MYIVYHHYKDRSRELEDVKDGWWTCPPELILSPKEDKQLTFLWRMWNGLDAYIVDPLGATQCNYVMLMELPWFIKWLTKFNPKKIECKHVFDLES